MPHSRQIIVWIGVALAVALPLGAAALSPLLAWREPVYIAAGFAGVAALCILFVQPLLIIGALPGLEGRKGRLLHPWLGCVLILAIVLHVGGLWITSPPDVVDALLLVSPTPFSAWGVLAMWAAFLAGLLAMLRRPLKLRWSNWRTAHMALTGCVVAGTIAHALLIEGTMEDITKIVLCLLVALVTTSTIVRTVQRQKPLR